MKHYNIQNYIRYKNDVEETIKNIPLKDLLLAKDNGYSFFWESIFLLDRKKFKISEVGIPMP